MWHLNYMDGYLLNSRDCGDCGCTSFIKNGNGKKVKRQDIYCPGQEADTGKSQLATQPPQLHLADKNFYATFSPS